jgi:hypothetical protein
VAGVKAARQLTQALMACALALAGAHAAEVGPSAPRTQTERPNSARPGNVHPNSVRPGNVHPGVAAVHPLPSRRPLAGGAAKIATATRAGTQPLAMRPGANRLTTALTVMPRSAVVGGPRTQERGTLGGPANGRSTIRGVNVQGGISGTALRRRS